MPKYQRAWPQEESIGGRLFQIEITNLRDIRGRFAAFHDEGAREWSRELLRKIGRLWVRYLKEEAPVGAHFTWRGEPIEPKKRLKDSFTFKTLVLSTGKLVLRVYSSVKHVKYVIKGVAPYKRGRVPIYPRNKRALAFWWERKKKSVIVAKVMHPGSLPNPFQERAYKRAQRETERLRRRASKFAIEALTAKGPGRFQEVF